ncbi:MAG: hypothetical protein ACUVRC_04655 [Desulfotomaculales bacterium]
MASLEHGSGEIEDAALADAVTRLLVEVAGRVIVAGAGGDRVQGRTVRVVEGEQDVEGGATRAAVPVTGFTAGRQEERILSDTIKVEQRHVDRLMDLAGELVVAKNSLPFLVREIEGAGLTLLARQRKTARPGVTLKVFSRLFAAYVAWCEGAGMEPRVDLFLSRCREILGPQAGRAARGRKRGERNGAAARGGADAGGSGPYPQPPGEHGAVRRAQGEAEPGFWFRPKLRSYADRMVWGWRNCPKSLRNNWLKRSRLKSLK